MERCVRSQMSLMSRLRNGCLFDQMIIMIEVVQFSTQILTWIDRKYYIGIVNLMGVSSNLSAEVTCSCHIDENKTHQGLEKYTWEIHLRNTIARPVSTAAAISAWPWLPKWGEGICGSSTWRNLFVQTTNCICPNWKMYLPKLQSVFVQIAKCICPN